MDLHHISISIFISGRNSVCGLYCEEKEGFAMREHKKVEVLELPKCDFCGQTAKYDGKTTLGPWGYMCLACFGVHGIGLGLGKGQELVVKE